MFKLEIETDNAAFEDGAELEIARILRNVAERLEYLDGLREGNARDINGNRVGRWELS